MSEPIISPLASQDLDGILEYIARDKPLAAISFVEKLKEKCSKVPFILRATIVNRIVWLGSIARPKERTAKKHLAD